MMTLGGLWEISDYDKQNYNLKQSMSDEEKHNK